MHRGIDPVPGIYCIRHKASGKCYVGSSANMRKRLYEHARLLTKSQHKNDHLQAAFAKYGPDAFEALVLQRVDVVADLYRIEQEYLLSMCTFDRSVGYNKSSDTTAPQRGLKRSPETCARIGTSKIGNTNRLGKGFTDEAKQQISESLRGRKASDATRAKLSAARKGVPKSLEWCEKMRAIHTGRVISPEQRAQISATLTGRNVRLESQRARAQLNTGETP